MPYQREREREKRDFICCRCITLHHSLVTNTAGAVTDKKDCCSFEKVVKEVTFYEGKEHLRPISHVYFKEDAVNVHHDKTYAVKLCCNDKMLLYSCHLL